MRCPRQARRREVRADQSARGRAPAAPGARQRRAACMSESGVDRARRAARRVEVVADHVDRVAPGVAFVFDELVEHGEGRRSLVLSSSPYSRAPMMRGELLKPDSVRLRPISRSGFRPASRRRKSLSSALSPKKTACSTAQRDMAGAGGPGRREGPESAVRMRCLCLVPPDAHRALDRVEGATRRTRVPAAS